MRTFVVLGCLLAAAGCAGVRTKPAGVPRPVQAEDVRFGGERRGYLVRPEGGPPSPAVVALHGEYGLTDVVKAHARRLAEKGYVVLAVDLYRGGKVADLDGAHILSRGLPTDQALGDVKAAVDFLCARADVRAEAVGILGWDMGGGYALEAAIADPRLKAVVNCYGRVKTDPAALAGLRAAVLALFAGKDEGLPPETREQFRAAMRQAGKRLHALHVYEGREHGFLTEAPHPDDKDTADAQSRIGAFFDAELLP